MGAKPQACVFPCSQGTKLHAPCPRHPSDVSPAPQPHCLTMRSLAQPTAPPEPPAASPTLEANAAPPTPEPSDVHTLKRLLPYLWQYKYRVVLALAFMVGAKVANVGVPILLKDLVDQMTPHPALGPLVVPLALLLAYGLLRLSVSVLTELRELVFAKARRGKLRSRPLRICTD